MMTLRQFAAEPTTIPMSTSWYLTDLSEARGKQELYTRQAPQKLQSMREHALVESAISSNRIEGIEVDKSRVATLIFGRSALHDRDEEEVRGYCYALKLIHEDGAKLPISETTIKQLHRLSRGEICDAGAYKEKDVDIIHTYPDGRSRVRFKSVSAVETPPAMAEMIELWQRGMRERWVHPLVLAAALNLDFLCIHPFRDGNGRVSRLLFLLASYHWRPRSRALHQPRTSHRTEQGTLLRGALTKLPGLARGQTRPVAGDQLSAFHPQRGVPGI